MARENLADLLVFIAVARERSFTRAAAQLGVTQSSISHTLRGLEERLGVRLLTRTTRSVSPTEAGERLLATIAPKIEEIDAELQALRQWSDAPSGTVRITTTDVVADTVIWPRLAPLLRANPGLRIEIETNYRLSEIVSERFEFGVRAGGDMAKDMTAVRITADFRRIVVASPAYIARCGHPATPEELVDHSCIGLRLASGGGLFSWTLRKGDRKLQIKVGSQLTLDNTYQILNGALNGCGLAFTMEPLARPHIEAGRLVSLLDDWAPTSRGFYLYYANRRQPTRAMQLVIDALRHSPRSKARAGRATP